MRHADVSAASTRRDSVALSDIALTGEYRWTVPAADSRKGHRSIIATAMPLVVQNISMHELFEPADVEAFKGEAIIPGDSRRAHGMVTMRVVVPTPAVQGEPAGQFLSSKTILRPSPRSG
jgi:hypothetical protein